MAKFCGKCGAKLDETTGLCPNCDAEKVNWYLDRQHCQESGNKACTNSSKNTNQKRSLIYKYFSLIAILAVTVVVSVAFYHTNNGISEEDYEKYIAYDNLLLELETKYLNESGYVSAEDVPQLLDEVEQIVKEGRNEGTISDYNRDAGNIYIKFSSGIGYLFIPYEGNILSNGDGGRILTIEPENDAIAFKMRALFSLIDGWNNKFEFRGPYSATASAELVKNEFGDLYKYSCFALPKAFLTHEYALMNEEVTVETMKKWGQNKIIIFEGHGAYNSRVHSCLQTGEEFVGFKRFSKYSKDIENDIIVLTSFPKLYGTEIPYSPVRSYCITSKFVTKYFDRMDNALVFLGACQSGKDDVLAQALLDQGASIVIGYSDITSIEYEMLTRSMFFYKLTQEKIPGSYFTVGEAFAYAQKSIGAADPFNEHRAELVCFSKGSIENQYTLNGMCNPEETAYEEGSNWDIDAELPKTFFSITSSLRVSWELILQGDGSFKSIIKNPDWGDHGEAYPNGTCYIAEKSGKFTSLEKVNDTTCKMVVGNIGYAEQEGETYIDNGTRYIVENESPINSGDVFYLFLPGTPHSEFPQGLMDSVSNNGRYSMDDITLNSYVLYHPDAESAGYELVFISEPDENVLGDRKRVTAGNIDMASTLGYSKVWEIYNDSESNPWVTALAFQENGIFCCGIGLPMSEWSFMFQGNYEIKGDEIIFQYAINGEEKETSYQISWTDKVFKQISEENLVIDHPAGSEYHFEESPDLTAAGLFYQFELFKGGPLEGWD